MPGTDSVVSRSQTTPDASRMTLRSSARWTGSAWAGAAAMRTARGHDRQRRSPVRPARSASLNSSSSSETSSSLAIAYSVLTDGRARPVSTWEMRLGERPSRPARSRRLRCRRRVRRAGGRPSRSTRAARCGWVSPPPHPSSWGWTCRRPLCNDVEQRRATLKAVSRSRDEEPARPTTGGRCSVTTVEIPAPTVQPIVRSGPPDRLARVDERRLGGALERRPAADVPPRSRARGAGRLGPRRDAALRLQQHPVRHEHPYRRVGARQDDPLRAPVTWRGPAHLGLRLGRQAPPAELPVAADREHPCRDDRAARRRRAGCRAVPRGRPGDRRRS